MARREIEFNKNKRFSDLWCECTADFVLPDFNGDVRKVLLFDATAYPSSSFPSGDYLECTGVVTFDMVYLNFDGEAESTSFNGDYSFKVKCSSDDYVDSMVDTKVSGVALRLLSPRKISAKASIASMVDIVSRGTQTSEGTALEEVFLPQLSSDSVKIRDTRFSEVFEREYAETVARFDDKTSDEVTVLYTSVKPVVDQVEAEDSSVKVRGSLKTSMLVKTDDTPMYKLEYTFPVDESIAFDGVTPDSDVTAKISIASVSTTTKGDDSGVDVILNVICETRLTVESNKECTVLTDAYICSCATENTYDSFSYNEYVKVVNETLEYSDKISVGGLEYDKIRDVIYTSVTPKIDSFEMCDGAMKITGEMKVSAIATEIKDDDTVEYTNLKFTTNFGDNVNIGCQIHDKIDVYPSISVSDVTCEVDSNNIYLKLNKHISTTVVASKNLKVLLATSAKEDIKFEKKPGRITVYYPEAKDTLYSVAKEFHTTKEKLLIDNSIAISTVATPDGEVSLSDVKRLIIT